MLKYHKCIKYRQINTKKLYDNLQSKCQQLNENIHKIFTIMQTSLQEFGFEKYSDNNWYYLNYDDTLPKLWECYKKWIKKQSMYYLYYLFVLLFIINKNMLHRYQTRESVRAAYVLSNKKWKYYEIAFDYDNRTIMLFDTNKSKIKCLQVGNPNKSSLEFNVHIRYFNDIDIHETCTKWACLILNHTWRFRTMSFMDRDCLSNCCA
ncbi:hypothetical protein RFI_00660, partial [Reticulomyxa filosa]